MRKKRIFYLSGTRADYGLMKTVLTAIDNHPLLDLGIIITALHLTEEMGNTGNEIEEDEFKIVDKIHSCLSSDSAAAMAKGIGLTLSGITQTFEREKPDMLLLLGDRGESLAAACAAAMMDIVVIHIHCGDISEGHIDNLTRFAISQYSHILMPATELSRERLLGTGVDNKNIYVVGAPGLDDIISQNFTIKEELLKKYSLKDKRTITVLYHPASAEKMDFKGNINTVLNAISKFPEYQVVIIGGNIDAGGRTILNEIGKREKVDCFVNNMAREDYLGLLNISSVLVGNSSSGIIESASFNLPVINIGASKKGRTCTDNVIHLNTDENEIKQEVKKALRDTNFTDKLKNIK
ncbi:MAG: UDP-N-acetylglucosamine 2-epimerase (hydrolyzing), partial [Bacteroidetes bacterium]|nr:UDP-N-acetylglucosamine 2-epimerase (hydrolyzing) [Bacteroidota bacterium]